MPDILGGSVSVATPSILDLANPWAPSSASLVIGTPSPLAPSDTGSQPVGNSSDFLSTFSDYVSNLESSVSGAVAGAVKSVEYKAQGIVSTAQLGYYNTVTAVSNAVASGAQTAQSVAKAVTGASTYLFLAIGLFIAAPYIIALMKRK